MKKLLPLIFAVMFFSINIYAGTNFSAASGANVDMQVYQSITAKGAAFDTIGAAGDSATLWSYQTFDPGWIYMVKNGIVTGGGSDSVKFLYRVDVYNASKTLVGQVYSSDTVKVATGSLIELPILRKTIGSFYTIKAIATTDNGGVVILNNFNIVRARYFNFDTK